MYPRFRVFAAPPPMVLREVKAEVKDRPHPKKQLLNYGIDQTPICIFFLGASELKKVLKYLQELSNSCGIGRF